MREQFSQTVKSFLLPILEFLEDSQITEILINRPDEIWIERHGRLQKTSAKFPSEEALMSAVNNVSQFVGRRISREEPAMDARLPDGSRIHVLLPPCSRKGICISIRKFPKDPLTVEKLLEYDALDSKTAGFLNACICAQKNILVSGGTGSGKTSLLNALSAFVPNDSRIIVIEDSAELKLQQDHVVYLETQMADRHGKGAVSIRDLLHSTLRLRPDRIIIGEIRGGEALDLLQALNTGHGGSMGTIHANSPKDALSRLEVLSQFSGVELSVSAIRHQIASAIDLVVQTSRFHDGSRKVTHISQVLPPKEDLSYHVEDIIRFNTGQKNEKGRIKGVWKTTGFVPSFVSTLEMLGFDYPKSFFEP